LLGHYEEVWLHIYKHKLAQQTEGQVQHTVPIFAINFYD